MRTSFALILYFRIVAHKAAWQRRLFSKSVKDIWSGSAMSEVPITQDFKVEDLS